MLVIRSIGAIASFLTIVAIISCDMTFAVDGHAASFKTCVKSHNITYKTSKNSLQLLGASAQGLRPRPAVGAYDAPPDPLVGWVQDKLPPLSRPSSHVQCPVP